MTLEWISLELYANLKYFLKSYYTCSEVNSAISIWLHYQFHSQKVAALNSWILIISFTHYLLTYCRVERTLYLHIAPFISSDSVIISQFLVKSIVYTFLGLQISLTAEPTHGFFLLQPFIFPGVNCFLPPIFLVVHVFTSKISRITATCQSIRFPSGQTHQFLLNMRPYSLFHPAPI